MENKTAQRPVITGSFEKGAPERAAEIEPISRLPPNSFTNITHRFKANFQALPVNLGKVINKHEFFFVDIT